MMSCDNSCSWLQCLLLTQLPFSEDLRPYYFGSLPASDKTTPTADQLEAVDNLITAMDLMEAHEWVGSVLMKGSSPCCLTESCINLVTGSMLIAGSSW